MILNKMKIFHIALSIIGFLCVIQNVCMAGDNANLDDVNYSWKNPVIEIKATNHKILHNKLIYQYELIYINQQNAACLLDVSSCDYAPYFCKDDDKCLISTYKLGNLIDIPYLRRDKDKTYLDLYQQTELKNIREIENDLARRAIMTSFGGVANPDFSRDFKDFEPYLAVIKISDNVDHVYTGVGYDVSEAGAKSHFYYVIFIWEYSFDKKNKKITAIPKSATVAYRVIDSKEYDLSNSRLISILKTIDAKSLSPLLKNINYKNKYPVLFVDEIKENNYHLSISNDDTKIAVTDVFSDTAPILIEYNIVQNFYFIITSSKGIEHLNIINLPQEHSELKQKPLFYDAASLELDFNDFDLIARSLIDENSKESSNIDIVKEKVKIINQNIPNLKETKNSKEFENTTSILQIYTYRTYYRVNQGSLSSEMIIDFYVGIGILKTTNKLKMFLLGSDKITVPELR